MPKQRCASNLGPKQKTARLLFGILMFIAASGVAFFMMWTEAPAFSKAIVFAPFFAAMLGFFQAKEKICVLYAAKGIQNLDGGAEKIQDAELAARLRRQSQKIIVQAVLLASVLTLLCILVG